jgi:hypothetical protein
LDSKDVALHFIKNGDHRLSSDAHLKSLISLTEELLPQ